MRVRYRRRWRRLTVVACALVIGGASCQWLRGDRPNILLIVVDTLRADRLSCYGNPRPLTPFLDELAAQGTLFRNAYATSAWTCPSVASLFTSRFPSQHRVTTFESILQDGEVTLGEKLRAAGYAPGGYVGNLRLVSSLGYAQGFRRWWIEVAEKTRGDQLRRQSVSWLRLPWPQPRFLYLHYMEPHAPYDPPEPHRSRWRRPHTDGADAASANRKLVETRWGELSPPEEALLESLYDGEVAAVDAEIRALFAELRQRGFLERAIVVVTADHGEEFRDHGGLVHGYTLHNEMVRVPLLIVAPGVAPGRVVEENVSLVDVAPTILALAGVPAEPRFEGRSLVPLMGPTPQPSPRAVLVELEPMGSRDDLRRHSEGLVQGASKLLVRPDGQRELYDLAADPHEAQPNHVPHPLEQRRALDAALDAMTADLRQRAGKEIKTQALDDATREKLRALGYQF